MAATPPPGYTPPPADLPQRGDRATFSNRVDAWVTWFSTVILPQLAAMVASAYANAVDAAASAVSALGAKTAAETARDAAQAARDTAQGYRDTALAYRDAAALSATDAQNSATASAASATALVATSTTSVAVGAGLKTFTTQAGKQFAPGVLVAVGSAGTPTSRMWGAVSSYSGTTLIVNVVDFTGTGSAADWAIAPGGATGPAGTLSAGNISGALNLAKAVPVASAASPDIWATIGNLVHITGTTTITGFANAPQPGAQRWLVADAAFTLTSGANLTVKGGTRKMEVGDVIVVTADTTTAFTAHVMRASGRATVAPLRYIELTTTQVWSTLAEDFIVELWGGGTGGGSNTSGPGAPGYVKKTFFGVPLGTAATLAIGTAGSGAAGDATDPPAVSWVAGSAGTATTFAISGFTTLSAGAGTVGLAANYGQAGIGGAASGGDINLPGEDGGNWMLAQNGTVSMGGFAGSNYLSNGGKSHWSSIGRQGNGFGASGASGGATYDTSAVLHGRTAGAAGRIGGCRIWY